jgi:hypothetical protein
MATGLGKVLTTLVMLLMVSYSAYRAKVMIDKSEYTVV